MARSPWAPLLAAALLAAPALAAEVEGRLVLEVPGLALADVAPTVVYLDDARGAAGAPPPTAVIHQRNALFSPPFLAVAVGQPVEMPNDDDIFHNVFSFSAPNDFDLGLYPAGRSRRITFRHPGPVRLYCSIHESMNATVFVSPTPFFAVADDAGRFRLRAVPEGEFELRTWSEKLPATARDIRVGPGTTRVEIPLGAASGR